MSGDPNKVTDSWEGWSGDEVTREFNIVLDVRDYIGTPGYSLLVVAANPHLSIMDLWNFLLNESFRQKRREIQRGRTWIHKRRWLFRKPDAVFQLHDRDGKQTRALALMAENPEMSVFDLSLFLKQNGIKRSREWVRRNRCVAIASGKPRTGVDS